ncbi:MAG: arsenate reductase [Pseudohongiellaceae bacterium]
MFEGLNILIKILFICTHNRCRSILAEAVAKHVGAGKIIAASAGSEPAGKIHPLTLEALKAAGVSVAGLRSKSWHELEDFAADVVITVCDNAANETCPVWLGNTKKVHWGLADPSALEGSGHSVMLAFQDTIDTLMSRLNKAVGMIERGIDKAVVIDSLVTLTEN